MRNKIKNTALYFYLIHELKFNSCEGNSAPRVLTCFIKDSASKSTIGDNMYNNELDELDKIVAEKRNSTQQST